MLAPDSGPASAGLPSTVMATLRQQWTKLTRTLGPETPEFLLLSTHTAESLVPGLGVALAEGSLPRRVTAHSYAVVPHALEQLSRSSERPAEVAVLGDFEGLFGHAPQDAGFDRDLGLLQDGLGGLAAAGTDVWVVLLGPPRELDAADGLGGGRLSQWYRANGALVELAAGTPQLHTVDLPSILMRQPGPAFDDRLWYLAMQPFTAPVLAELAAALVRSVAAARRVPYKALAVDCDGVLWGGILGEDGPQGIKIGGTDPVGRAYEATQRYLVRLAQRGVLIALCSKNAADDVWNVIDTHPGMALRRRDIAAAQINWRTKSENIIAIAEELGILPEAIVFIDDNPAEVAEVTARLPACLSVLVPSDPVEVPCLLAGAGWFDVSHVTDEDRGRVEMMATEEERRRRATELGDADYLGDLELRVEVADIDERTIARVAQLLGKTNQFNVSVRRHDETAIRALLDRPGWFGSTVTVSDRFGGYGLTGVVIAGPEDGRMTIDSFLLSCRILGRNVEDVMLGAVIERARARGSDTVRAEVAFTDRNHPARAFLGRRGFAPPDADVQELALEGTEVEWPRHVAVSGLEVAR